MRASQVLPFSSAARSSRLPRDSVADRDPICPDCKGKCQDRHGFDCVRCGGEGMVDE